MEHVNPLFDRRPSQALTTASPPPSQRKRPSAKIERIIRELDVRYPPNATISERDREARILLLASDVADLDPAMLEIAAAEWVRTKNWMPKASELRNYAGEAQRRGEDPDDRVAKGRRVAENYNQRLAAETPDKGIRWVYDEKADSLKLMPLRELHARPEPRCTPEEAAEIRRMMWGNA